MAMIKGLPATEPSNDGIQNALGLTGYTDYAVLIRPDLYGPKQNIVKFWAKFQPVHSSKLHKLTDAERKALAYGIKDNTNYSLSQTNTFNSAFNNAVGGTYSWIRQKPTGEIDSSPFRPWDYYSEDGTLSYDNEAECPFEFNEQNLHKGSLAIAVGVKTNLGAGNITLEDLTEISANGLITKTKNTCFGLLYKKDNGSVTMIGQNGEYPAFSENGSAMEHTISVEGTGTYTVVPIILNPSKGLYATIPMPYREFVVDNTEVLNAQLFGEWEPNATNTAIILTGWIQAINGSLPAGSVEVIGTPVGTDKSKIDSAKLWTSGPYSYSATTKDGISYWANNVTINQSPTNVDIWARVSINSLGVIVTQLDQKDNSGDVQ